MSKRHLSGRYADASQDELLDLLDNLLREQEACATQIEALHIEVSMQRLAGWNKGFEWGWRACLRDIQRKPR
jgi:hypothetical protein